MQIVHPFDPVVDAGSKVLVLGSFPSIKSFEKHFYYAHPRNAFWPIMEALFGVTLEDNDRKKAFAHEHAIALWDTYGSLKRTKNNSSDTNLCDLVPNDIPALLQRYPRIKTIFCTGKKSYEGLRRHFPDLDAKIVLLPSTSAAYAAMTFEEKLAAYRVIKDTLDADA